MSFIVMTGTAKVLNLSAIRAVGSCAADTEECRYFHTGVLLIQTYLNLGQNKHAEQTLHEFELRAKEFCRAKEDVYIAKTDVLWARLYSHQLKAESALKHTLSAISSEPDPLARVGSHNCTVNVSYNMFSLLITRAILRHYFISLFPFCRQITCIDSARCSNVLARANRL